MTTNEILIPCEGSGGYGHQTSTMDFGESGFTDQLMCKMCGGFMAADANGLVPEHKRDDILARIARGDFDAS